MLDSRCKCSGKRQMTVPRSLPGSDSWLLKRKSDDPFCRLHSLPPSSRTRNTLSSRSAMNEPELTSSNTKLVRLHLAPRRTRSMRADQSTSASSAHCREDNSGQQIYSRHSNKLHRPKSHRCHQHRQRRPSSSSSPSSPSIVQIHQRRQIFSQPIGGGGGHRYPKSTSTT